MSGKSLPELHPQTVRQPRTQFREIKAGAAATGRGLYTHEREKSNPCTVTEAARPEQATGGLAGDQSGSLQAIHADTKRGEQYDH